MPTQEFDPQNPASSSENDSDAAPAFESRVDLSSLAAVAENIRSEVGKIIVGQSEMIDLLIAAILANGHVLIEGVPGVAKTLTAKVLAHVIDAEMKRIQFTPDLMPSDVIGTSIFNPGQNTFEFKKGPVFGNIVLIDEINRAPAKTQAALFEVMEERQITVDSNTYPISEPFFIVATQNPIEHEGTYRLPEAQLDRFLFKIEVPYPNLEQELSILEGAQQTKEKDFKALLKKIITKDEILKQRALLRHIRVEQSVMHYIASIIHKTRNNSSIYVGASPRASVNLMRASQAWAAMRGRDFVIPDDVKTVCYPVLRHRIILTPEVEMEGIKVDEIVNRILEQVEVPR